MQKESLKNKIAFFDGRPFLILILLEALLFLYLFFTWRIPAGHDGFQFYSLQYYFLNNAVISGEIPQWMPFNTHGSIATWWYDIQGGLLQNFLLLIAGKLPFQMVSFNFFYYLGIFCESAFFLCGMWLWGKQFGLSKTSLFFVGTTALGSLFWSSQPWWNFHFYYAVPFIIFLFHQFFARKDFVYFLLGIQLLLFQCLGTLQYFFPVVCLLIFAYFFFFVLFQYKQVILLKNKVRWGKTSWLLLATTLILVVGLFIVFFTGTEQTINSNYGRNPDLSSKIDVFLHYGLNTSLKKWAELLLGFSPALDYNLFLGFLSFALIIFVPGHQFKRKSMPLYCALIFGLMFASGTWVSKMAFLFWPGMKYFRHLSLCAPLLKLFVIMIAGLNFERVFVERRTSIKKSSIGLVFFCLIGVAGFLLFCYLVPYTGRLTFYQMVERGAFVMSSSAEPAPRYFSGLPALDAILFSKTLSLWFLRSFFAVMMIACAFLAFYLVPQRMKKKVIFILLLFHVLDMYSYKAIWLKETTQVVPRQLRQILFFQKMPYNFRRILDLSQQTVVSNDDNLTSGVQSQVDRSELLKILKLKNFYCSANSFLFKDEIGYTFRVDHIPLPLAMYLNTYWKKSFNEITLPPESFPFFQDVQFPLDHPAAGRISGLYNDKIQFFLAPEYVAQIERLVDLMRGPRYLGDKLFISPLINAQEPSEDAAQKKDGAAGDRVDLPYHILGFDANNLKLSVTIPPLFTNVFLFYSDGWHPFWKASVNGLNQPVRQANLAYKAVRLEAGENIVHFRFGNILLSFGYWVFGLFSLFWLTLTIFFIKREIL